MLVGSHAHGAEGQADLKSTKEHIDSHESRGHKTRYNHRFDAFACLTCDEWLESKCHDPFCNYCSKRPKKPSSEVDGENGEWELC